MQRKQLKFNEERKNTSRFIQDINFERTAISLFLDGIHNIENAGLLLRLADAARLNKVYLYNCKFDLQSEKLKRIARSVIDYIEIEEITSDESVEQLKMISILIAVEKTNDSIEYQQMDFEKINNNEIVLVVGSEKFGISNFVLQQCNYAVHLPMLGVNTSMNVACAATAIVYWII